jgi:predicted DNA-binding transcriptional regulator AlpA
MHSPVTPTPAPTNPDCRELAAAVPGEKLLRLPSVLDLTGRGRTAWLDDVKVGKAPKPIKIGSASFWLWSEVQGYIADRIRESRGGVR